MEIADVLSQAGFDPIGPARSAAQAFELINGSGCDAAVLDINLGSETTEPVACELAARQTPFIGLTSYAPHKQPPIFQRATVLSKPMQSERLISEIQRCLEADADA